MFEKMKQLMEMQKMAAAAEKRLEGLRIEKDSHGGQLRVVMNGKNKIESLSIDTSWLSPDRKASLEAALSRLFSDSAEAVQKAAAESAREMMKGLNIPGL